MDLKIAIDKIIEELKRAEKIHGGWPEDIIHQAAIVSEEAGELLQGAITYHYTKDLSSKECKKLMKETLLKKEAIHTGAMALRFLINMEE